MRALGRGGHAAWEARCVGVWRGVSLRVCRGGTPLIAGEGGCGTFSTLMARPWRSVSSRYLMASSCSCTAIKGMSGDETCVSMLSLQRLVHLNEGMGHERRE